MSDSDLEAELLVVAHAASRAAAVELSSRFGRRQREIRAKSSPTDLVSEADLAAEAAIRRLLGELRPGDAILGEEGGETGEGELRWVIDPLDGTTNFLFGIPQFAVSVACEDRDGALVGVVLDPVRDESFAASRSGSPELNGSVIESSRRQHLSTALVATGFAYEADLRGRQSVVLVAWRNPTTTGLDRRLNERDLGLLRQEAACFLADVQALVGFLEVLPRPPCWEVKTAPGVPRPTFVPWADLERASQTDDAQVAWWARIEIGQIPEVVDWLERHFLLRRRPRSLRGCLRVNGLTVRWRALLS